MVAEISGEEGEPCGEELRCDSEFGGVVVHEEGIAGARIRSVFHRRREHGESVIRLVG